MTPTKERIPIYLLTVPTFNDFTYWIGILNVYRGIYDLKMNLKLYYISSLLYSSPSHFVADAIIEPKWKYQ